MPTSMRKQALLAAGLGCALAGCLDSEAKSDLNTDGDPRVVTVTVYSESAVADEIPYGMGTVYCSNNAGDKVSEAYCPGGEAVADVWPLGWRAWIAFNELLLGDEVETIEGNTGVLNDGIVSITCGGEALEYGAAFSGWYDPSGSHLTLPIGPAIVISPNPSVAATGADCEISLNEGSVHDKEGNPIAAAGPFAFKVAPMRLASRDLEGTTPTVPAHEAKDVRLDVEPEVAFNAHVDLASVGENITLKDSAGTSVPFSVAYKQIKNPNTGEVVREVPNVLALKPTEQLAAGADYTIVVSSGIKDIKGGELVLDAPYEATFTTVMAN